jgi:FKBP12-rapamycin complex-associated protein
MNRKNKSHNEMPAYQCISMLAISVGPALTKHMHEMLDSMFGIGLTESLRSALVDLSTNIPPLLPTIQERLLDMLSVILFSRPYAHPGTPGKGHLYPTLAIREVSISKKSNSV